VNDPGIFRKVYTRMWRYGSSFQRLSKMNPCGQALWLYLLTSEHSIIIPGVILAGPATIAETLGWEPSDVVTAFDELFREGMVVADFTARVVVLVNSDEYHSPLNPNVLTAWGKAYDKIPECALKKTVYDMVYQSIKLLPKSFAKSFAKSFEESLPESFGESFDESFQVKEKEREKKKGKGEGSKDQKSVKSDPSTTHNLALKLFEHVKDRQVGKPKENMIEHESEFIDRYQNTIRLMIERDGHEPADIYDAIQFLQDSQPGRGGFCWGDVVLSDTKLRKHLGPEGQLSVKVKRAKGKQIATSHEDVESCLSDLNGGEF